MLDEPARRRAVRHPTMPADRVPARSWCARRCASASARFKPPGRRRGLRSLPVVYGDRPRLVQAFQHLLDNAAKTGRRAGTRVGGSGGARKGARLSSCATTASASTRGTTRVSSTSSRARSAIGGRRASASPSCGASWRASRRPSAGRVERPRPGDGGVRDPPSLAAGGHRPYARGCAPSGMNWSGT